VPLALAPVPLRVYVMQQRVLLRRRTHGKLPAAQRLTLPPRALNCARNRMSARQLIGSLQALCCARRKMRPQRVRAWWPQRTLVLGQARASAVPG